MKKKFNFKKAAQLVQLVIFDVDGTLTDGQIILTDKQDELKAFYVQDGLGIQFLQEAGIPVAVITAKQSDLVARRMESLGIQHVYQGQRDKRAAYEALLETLHLTDQQVAYVGDDVLDLPFIRRAGLGIAVANAVPFVKKHANFITRQAGGHGAAREVCDLILQAKGLYASIYSRYL